MQVEDGDCQLTMESSSRPGGNGERQRCWTQLQVGGSVDGVAGVGSCKLNVMNQPTVVLQVLKDGGGSVT